MADANVSIASLHDLGVALGRAGIDHNSYALDGGHPSERYVFATEEDGWSVYYSERGLETGKRIFQSEAEACRHLYSILLNDQPTRRR